MTMRPALTLPDPGLTLDIAAFARWAAAADSVRATTRRLEKLAELSRYFVTLDEESLAVAARFFSGIVFPRHDARTTQVGGSIIYGALRAVTGLGEEHIRERYVALGDPGDLAAELLAGRPPRGAKLAAVQELFERLAPAGGANERRALVTDALASSGAIEAKYIVKLLSGELRIGLKEAQVEEALARAFERPLSAVRRANLLRGDIGEVAQAARAGSLEHVALALFHPIGFMLASPLETAEEIVGAMPAPFAVEDKYDGIRAQAHIGAGQVRLFSRTLDDITNGYPEVVAALGAIGDDLVLDGELLPMDPAQPWRALPFTALQRRLGRKAPNEELMSAVPVVFVAYDVLAAREDGEPRLIVDEPWTRRRERLESLPWPNTGARLAPSRLVSSAEEIEAAFEGARDSGNEGLICKDPSSPYTPGRRGRAWVKLKRALATLDVVIVGAERGHGRRAGVLSDYTFAVRAGEGDPALLTVGKAYNGLTDAEIAALTERLHALTEERFGRYHRVRPEIVLEVTFDRVQRSARHKSGYALRFPRIVRIRDDKPAREVDTLARVRALAEQLDAPAAARALEDAASEEGRGAGEAADDARESAGDASDATGTGERRGGAAGAGADEDEPRAGPGRGARGGEVSA